MTSDFACSGGRHSSAVLTAWMRPLKMLLFTKKVRDNSGSHTCSITRTSGQATQCRKRTNTAEGGEMRRS